MTAFPPTVTEVVPEDSVSPPAVTDAVHANSGSRPPPEACCTCRFNILAHRYRCIAYGFLFPPPPASGETRVVPSVQVRSAPISECSLRAKDGVVGTRSRVTTPPVCRHLIWEDSRTLGLWMEMMTLLTRPFFPASSVLQRRKRWKRHLVMPPTFMRLITSDRCASVLAPGSHPFSVGKPETRKG